VAVTVSRIPFRDGDRALAAGLLRQAVKDMQNTSEQSQAQLRHSRDRGELRVEATVWLGSKAATRWFDVVGVEQHYALEKAGWGKHAEELLAAGGPLIGPESRVVMEMGLDALELGGVRCRRVLDVP